MLSSYWNIFFFIITLIIILTLLVAPNLLMTRVPFMACIQKYCLTHYLYVLWVFMDHWLICNFFLYVVEASGLIWWLLPDLLSHMFLLASTKVACWEISYIMNVLILSGYLSIRSLLVINPIALDCSDLLIGLGFWELLDLYLSI